MAVLKLSCTARARVGSTQGAGGAAEGTGAAAAATTALRPCALLPAATAATGSVAASSVDAGAAAAAACRARLPKRDAGFAAPVLPAAGAAGEGIGASPSGKAAVVADGALVDAATPVTALRAVVTVGGSIGARGASLTIKPTVPVGRDATCPVSSLPRKLASQAPASGGRGGAREHGSASGSRAAASKRGTCRRQHKKRPRQL